MLEGPEKEVSMKVQRALGFFQVFDRCSAPRGRLGALSDLFKLLSLLLSLIFFIHVHFVSYHLYTFLYNSYLFVCIECLSHFFQVVGDDKDQLCPVGNLIPSQEGWATVAGNQGTVFLQEGGHLWKAVLRLVSDSLVCRP